MTQKSLLHAVAAQIANGYETAEVPMYSEHLRMPDRKVIIKIIENLQKVFFPAYFAGGTVSHVSAETFAEFLLGEIYTDLREQVHLAFSNTIADESELRERTNAVCDRFLCRLPQIQTILMKDVTANFDGDPAAGSKEEVIFSYRVAHELYESGVPLIPRIMSEYAHGATGIDINPGAKIGSYFFIDHGTGIVVGETTVIGDHVKLYQGVTLGAKSFEVDADGNPVTSDSATFKLAASYADAVAGTFIKNGSTSADLTATSSLADGTAVFSGLSARALTSGGAAYTGIGDAVAAARANLGAPQTVELWLVETDAPDGYRILQAPQKVTLRIAKATADATVSSTVVDGPLSVVNTMNGQEGGGNFALPNTGGMGAVAFLVAGAALVAFAVASFARSRKGGKHGPSGR